MRQEYGAEADADTAQQRLHRRRGDAAEAGRLQQHGDGDASAHQGHAAVPDQVHESREGGTWRAGVPLCSYHAARASRQMRTLFKT